MAREDFSLKIDRRRLLTTALALPAASIVPIGRPVETAAVGSIRSSAMAPEAEAANVCAATARRLLEIAQRNEIRQQAGLPLLPVVRELRQMKEQADREEFERFAAAHGGIVLDELLKRRREAEGDPNWRPNSFEGMSLQNQVHNTLWGQFQASRRAASA